MSIENPTIDAPQPKGLGSCPFTRGRLEELYWNEKKSQREIGILAAEIVGREKPFAIMTVSGWMKAAGVKTVSPKNRKLRCKISPKKGFYANSERQRQWMQTLAERKRKGEWKYTIRKACLVSAKKSQERAAITLQCNYCNSTFTRRQSRVYTELVFCDRRCSAKYFNSKRLESKLILSSVSGVRVGYVLRKCQYCQEDFQRPKKHDADSNRRGMGCYCSSACWGKARAERNQIAKESSESALPHVPSWCMGHTQQVEEAIS